MDWYGSNNLPAFHTTYPRCSDLFNTILQQPHSQCRTPCAILFEFASRIGYTVRSPLSTTRSQPCVLAISSYATVGWAGTDHPSSRALGTSKSDHRCAVDHCRAGPPTCAGRDWAGLWPVTSLAYPECLIRAQHRQRSCQGSRSRLASPARCLVRTTRASLSHLHCEAQRSNNIRLFAASARPARPGGPYLSVPDTLEARTWANLICPQLPPAPCFGGFAVTHASSKVLHPSTILVQYLAW